MAVVDDLIAIVIIAVAYTSDLSLPALAAALVPLAAFGVLVQRRVVRWWLLVPLALATWGLVHASGVHATVAGVLLAFTLPAQHPGRRGAQRLRTPRTSRRTAQRRCGGPGVRV